MSTEKHKQVIRDFTRIFKNEHDPERVDHLFSKNFIHNFRMPVSAGLAGFKEVGHMMNSAFPDVHVSEQDLIASEDKIIERSSAVGTHKGEFMGIPPSNKEVSWTEIHIYRFENERIAEHWVELSTFELMQAIQGIPTSA